MSPRFVGSLMFLLVPSLTFAAFAQPLGVAGYYGRENVAPSGAAPRDTALALPAAWDAGVTDEALSRGFSYEELKRSMSGPLARLVGMAPLTGARVPGEPGQRLNAAQITVGLASRAVFSLLAEFAYDDGGLPESVALHVLWDTVAVAASTWTGLGFVREALVGSARSCTSSAQPRAFVVPLLSSRW